MPISVLSVNPLLKSITTNMGDGVEVFINGIPASSVEVQNIRTEDVKKLSIWNNHLIRVLTMHATH